MTEGLAETIFYSAAAGFFPFFICFVYGGLFVFVVPIAIRIWVLPSPDPAVRWQVLQVLQMVHGVWPPFLVGFFWPWLRRKGHERIRTALANLEHVA